MWIPRGFGEAQLRGEVVPVGVSVDGTNSSVAGRAAAYASRIVGHQLAWSGDVRPGQVHSLILYNPELRSRFYMVPGNVVLIVTIISALMTGMAVLWFRLPFEGSVLLPAGCALAGCPPPGRCVQRHVWVA